MKHIEDLHIYDFYNLVNNLNSASVVEKIDGYSIAFGFDSTGYFYTRYGKSKHIHSNADSYPNKFWATPFRSAHIFLSQLFTKDWVSMASPIEFQAEILYGQQPNTIKYNNDTNIIVITGCNDRQVYDTLLRSLNPNKEYYSHLTIPFTIDGINTKKVKKLDRWKIANLELKRLDRPNIIELESLLLSIPEFTEDFKFFNTIDKRTNPNVKARFKTAATKKYREYKEEFEKQKLLIKQQLLPNIHYTQSQFGPNIDQGGWIEGYVIGYNGIVCKLVDKNAFTRANEFLHCVQNNISDTWEKEVISTLSKDIYHVELHERKTSFSTRLENRLKEYMNHRNDFMIFIELGDRKIIIDYNGQAHQKTLQVFKDQFDFLSDSIEAKEMENSIIIRNILGFHNQTPCTSCDL